MLDGNASRIDELGSRVRFNMAVACAQLGRIDEAFQHLERVVEERQTTPAALVLEPLLAPLRSDPRFEELKRRVGVP